jgi:peptidoglycan/xylan/chitin deacetylase (PgdA/CDA1 family)
MYHSLDESGSCNSLSPQVFFRQMKALCNWGFQGIRLGDLLTAWEGKGTLPPRPVVLTFDDGFRSVLEKGVPVLNELRFQATIFAVAGCGGGTNAWRSFSGSPRFPLLSWAELRELAAAGFEIGAHGVRHEPLTYVSEEVARHEILGSQQVLQQELGQPVSVFAYPYGLANAAIRNLVRAHYRGACSVVPGRARPGNDRCWLPRIACSFRSQLLFYLLFTPLGQALLYSRVLRLVFRNALRARLIRKRMRTRS